MLRLLDLSNIETFMGDTYNNLFKGIYSIDLPEGELTDSEESQMAKLLVTLTNSLVRMNCADKNCKISPVTHPHFHCPNCGAPYTLDDCQNYLFAKNMPHVCTWCDHKLKYPYAYWDSLKQIDQLIAKYEKRYLASFDTKDPKPQVDVDGVWRNGTFYSYNYGPVSYDPLHKDSTTDYAQGYDEDIPKY